MTSHGLDELASAIGHVAIAWGTLQDNLGNLFSAILSNGELTAVALDSWHSLKSDLAQREMLEAAAKAGIITRKQLRDWIVKIARNVTAMSDRRNDIIHASYATLTTIDGRSVVIPHHHFGNRRAAKLAKEIKEGTLLQEILAFRAKIEGAIADCEEAFQCVVDPDRVPLRGISAQREPGPW